MSEVRVILVEMMDRLLLAFPPELGNKAARDLEKMGVDIRLNTGVTDYKDEVLTFRDGTSYVRSYRDMGRRRAGCQTRRSGRRGTPTWTSRTQSTRTCDCRSIRTSG